MDTTITSTELEALREVALQGSQRAAESLGLFSGEILTVKNARASICQLEDVSHLESRLDEVVVGVHFEITGDINGYLLAFFHESDALFLTTSLMGECPPGIQEFDEMALSAIGEAGNIVVASFLAALEPLCGLDAMPSPPAVAIEMCGAILTTAILPVIECGGQILLLLADIVPTDTPAEQAASCHILFLPTPDSWVLLRNALQQPNKS
ncbi:MAG: chemotaxis protein CheC [Armatimonadota bacterium]